MSGQDDRQKLPLRPVHLNPMETAVERRADGAIILRARDRLGPYPSRLTERLEHWAKATPERTFIAARDKSGGWRRLSYAQTLAAVRCIGEALLTRDLSAERPIAILSGNDIEHALLALAAMHVGIPYAPISPAYALAMDDRTRLRGIFDLLRPGMVFVAETWSFLPALSALESNFEIVSGADEAVGHVTPFSSLCATPAGLAVDAAAAKVGPDTIAKFLFTSGSTGHPKAVINTQRMLCSNQEMIAACWPFLREEPSDLLDWSPWHHTAGGNHNFGIALYTGGSFYIDDGKPTPAGIEATVRNLRDVAPAFYFNVPRGYEALIPHLRADKALREKFFSKLKMLYVAGAGLSQPVWDALNALAVETTGERVLLASGLGSTETAPFALVCTWDQRDAGNCGLPAPGLEFKLAPLEGKLEGRVKGPSVTPGYWREPKLTADAFDEEGYYRLGDALRFADPQDVAKGLVYDGRLAENFKLGTGTWVTVGALRARFVSHFAPYAADVVITGLNRDYLGALIFPNPDACAPLGDAAAGKFAELLKSFAATSSGSSNRIDRALILAEPPSMPAGEITDKGSINQRGVLARRASDVERLYAEPPGPGIILWNQP